METRNQLSLLEHSTHYSKLAHGQIPPLYLQLLAVILVPPRSKIHPKKRRIFTPFLHSQIHTDLRTSTLKIDIGDNHHKGTQQLGQFLEQTYPLIST